jgi:phosphonate transport system substrate-binding protein
MNVFRQMERYKPLAEYLTREAGIEIKLTILSRYGNIVESFSKGQMDAAFFGSFTGALAIQQLQVTPLARPVNLDGESTYHGLLYTRKDSGITSLADMKGKKFAFVDKATTAGYVFPLAYLHGQGITNLDAFFSEYFFTGSHDASLQAVLNGGAQLGASKNSVYDAELRRDPSIAQKIAILARSAPVPSNGLCVRQDLDETIKTRLKAVLLDMERSEKGRTALNKLGALRFVDTRAEDYQPVIDMATQAGIDLKRYNYKNE